MKSVIETVHRNGLGAEMSATSEQRHCPNPQAKLRQAVGNVKLDERGVDPWRLIVFTSAHVSFFAHARICLIGMVTSLLSL